RARRFREGGGRGGEDPHPGGGRRGRGDREEGAAPHHEQGQRTEEARGGLTPCPRRVRGIYIREEIEWHSSRASGTNRTRPGNTRHSSSCAPTPPTTASRR